MNDPHQAMTYRGLEDHPSLEECERIMRKQDRQNAPMHGFYSDLVELLFLILALLFLIILTAYGLYDLINML